MVLSELDIIRCPLPANLVGNKCVSKPLCFTIFKNECVQWPNGKKVN